MTNEVSKRLRKLPAVHEVLAELAGKEEIRVYTGKAGKQRLTNIIRQVLQKARQNISAAELAEPWNLPLEEFSHELSVWIKNEVVSILKKPAAGLRPLINATGVILHTNCGRALLSPSVAEFVRDQACRYSNLELDVHTGERGSRYDHVEKLLTDLTGAEAAIVVNNNAAAVLLVMNALAANKEVIVSRGELVEVGGSFRIPEILKAGGVRLVEVGTTNKTWLKDYESAITLDTVMLLKVHTSNYKIEGFTHSVPEKELIDLGQKWKIPVVKDLGSGTFYDGATLGLPVEPTIAESIKMGFSLVTFSGDKLLGGPQAGIIIGKSEFVAYLRNSQLLRALRIDKLSLAALEATLRIYQQGNFDEIPVWKMLGLSGEELRNKAELLKNYLEKNSDLITEIQPNFSRVGGGAWPTVKLPTWVCAIRPRNDLVYDLERFLRNGPLPILTRIHKDWVLIDPRTLLENDIAGIVERLTDWGRQFADTNES
jgi:L-seryl-tRNA(Ser) seleniumtransferase